jgi:FlaA1/EpsC-like NDP-sugar epimerase
MNFFNISNLKIAIVIVYDALIAIIALWLAILLRYDFTLPADTLNLFKNYGFIYAIICTGFYIKYNLHKNIWHYTTARDLMRFCYATVFAILIGGIALSLTIGLTHFPRSVFIILPLIQIALSAAPRIFLRLWHDKVFQTALQPSHINQENNILLVGVSDATDLFIRQTRRKRPSPYNILGAIDVNALQKGRLFHGIQILGSLDDLTKALITLEKKNTPVKQLIISDLTGPKLKQVIDIASEKEIAIKRIPSISNLKDGKTLTDLKPVMIEDLLGRDPVQLDMTTIQNFIENKIVLVTGAGGSIGRELSRQIATHSPKKLLLLDHSEDALYHVDMELTKKHPNLPIESLLVDIKNKDDIQSLFKTYNPEIVFHAAAYKHVPMIEKNPISGVENNFIGTKILVDTAIEFKTEKVVIVSTDKAVNPTNVMGATKRAAEMYSLAVSKETKTHVMAVRFGNVLGSNGSVIPLFRRQIMEGGPVTLTHKDATRYFMTIPEATQLILQAGAQGKGGDLFMLDMGESVRILHLAEEMIRLSGLKPYEDIGIEITGLRPGEKLYEELWYDAEGMSKTPLEKTFLVNPKSLSKTETEEKTLKILDACKQENAFKTVQNLKELVKEYQPAQNSPYVKLRDKKGV